MKVNLVNCREWWSRKVDLMFVLRGRKLDILGLAETFFQKVKEVGTGSIVGGQWWDRYNGG